MSGVTTREISPADAGMRLDRWFKNEFPTLSFGQMSKLLRTGQVRVNGKRVKGNARLGVGDMIRVPPMNLEAAPDRERAARPLSKDDIRAAREMVIYQDDELVALNKPAGLAVQGGTGTARHVDGLLPALKAKNDPDNPRLVHRLDKDTSGVLVVARTAPAARRLTRAFRDKQCHKIYWALVKGVPKIPEGKIDAPLGKGAIGGAKEKMHIGDEGKQAVTYYKVLDSAVPAASWVALVPLTGRTHQLRAHMAHIGHPILGDGKYGGAEAHIGGLSGKLHLHAAALSLPRAKGGVLRLTAPLPAHMLESFRTLGFNAAEIKDPFEGLEI